MLNGSENFHLHEIWGEAGALPMRGPAGEIPVAYLVDYPIFGIETAGEFCDYFVNLGPLTRVEME